LEKGVSVFQAGPRLSVVVFADSEKAVTASIKIKNPYRKIMNLIHLRATLFIESKNEYVMADIIRVISIRNMTEFPIHTRYISIPEKVHTFLSMHKYSANMRSKITKKKQIILQINNSRLRFKID
jgi:hypothetical protein